VGTEIDGTGLGSRPTAGRGNSGVEHSDICKIASTIYKHATQFSLLLTSFATSTLYVTCSKLTYVSVNDAKSQRNL
jgi:hypothetical protein